MSSLSLPEYEGNGGNYIIVCRAAPRAGGRRASPPGGATQKSSAAVVSLGYIPRVMGKDLALRLGVVPITLVDIEVTSVIEHTQDCGYKCQSRPYKHRTYTPAFISTYQPYCLHVTTNAHPRDTRISGRARGWGPGARGAQAVQGES